MYKSKISKKYRFIVLLVFLTLLCFYPYQFYDLPLFSFIPSATVLILVFAVLFLFLLILLGTSVKIPKSVNTVLVLQILGLCVSFFIDHSLSYILDIFIMFLSIEMIVSIKSTIGLVYFYNVYNKWIALMTIGGTIVFFLVLLGVPPLFQYTNSRDLRNFYSWGISFSNYYIPSVHMVRYSGFFDEPGAMAYWVTYALAFNKLFIKNKKIESILLLCTLFTFSLGYYVQLLIYILLFYFTSLKKLVRNPLFFLAFAFFVFAILKTKDTDYSIIYDNSIGRLVNLAEGLNSDILTSGDGRGELEREAKAYFLNHPIFGVGRTQWENLPYMGDNRFETLAKDGIFGTLYIYLPFIFLILLAAYIKDAEMFKVILFLSIGFLHRPFHSFPLNFFIMYSFLFMCLERKRNITSI